MSHAPEHECVFVEEQEPSGRLVLPPCIICGLTAMDALDQLHQAQARVEALADGWDATAAESRPHLGCLDMHRHLAAELRAALDGDGSR